MNSKYTLVLALSAVVAGAAGCGDNPTNPTRDLSMESMLDLSATTDLSGSVNDLSGSVDLRPPVDMAIPPDATPVTVDVRDCQDPSRPTAVPTNTIVRLTNVIVTARRDSTGSTRLFVQERTGSPEWSGIMVFVDTNPAPAFTLPAVGDVVTIDGRITEFTRNGFPGSRTNIDPVANIQILQTGQTLPAPAVVAMSELVYAEATPDGGQLTSPSEKWEGVLVRVNGVTVQSRDANGETTLVGGLKIDDLLFAYPQPYPGDTYTAIVGPMEQDFGNMRILPRDANDLIGYVAAPAHVASVTPPTAQVAVGERVTLTVTLDRPAPMGGQVVDLSSSDNTVANPVTSTVTVAAGMTTATFEVEGLASSNATITIGAKIGSDTPKTASVTIAPPPSVTAIAPASLELIPNGTGIYTVTLSRAAGSLGFVVNLSAGTNEVSVPASVTVPSGSTFATFQVKAGAATTSTNVTITASGNGTANATAKVVAAGSAPTVGDLIINEILFDPPTGAAGDASCNGTRATDDEFVELVNVSTKTLAMDGVSIWDSTNNTSIGTTRRYRFSTITLGPGEAVVVFGEAYGTASTAPWCVDLRAATGTRVFSSGGFGLGNSGDTVYVTAGDVNTSTILAQQKWTTNSVAAGVSWARSPDLTGAFTAYTSITNRKMDRVFTPGTRVDGRPFADVAAP